MEELLKELDEIKQKMAKIGKKIVEIEKKIEEEEKNEKNERWKPEKGDIYWFISNSGYISESKWDNDSIDKGRYSIGNCYKTEEECEFAVEKLKVIAELKKYAESKNRVWDGKNEHFFFYYDYMTKEVRISYNNDCKSRKIYFESEEKIKQAIASIGKDKIKKYYLEVEE